MLLYMVYATRENYTGRENTRDEITELCLILDVSSANGNELVRVLPKVGEPFLCWYNKCIETTKEASRAYAYIGR